MKKVSENDESKFKDWFSWEIDSSDLPLIVEDLLLQTSVFNCRYGNWWDFPVDFTFLVSDYQCPVTKI